MQVIRNSLVNEISRQLIQKHTEPNDNAEEQESGTGELAPDEENVAEGESPDNQNPEETIPPSDTEDT